MALGTYLIWDAYNGGSMADSLDEAVKTVKRRASSLASKSKDYDVGLFQLIKKAETPIPEIQVIDVAPPATT